MSGDQQIIIKKVKKVSGHGHHGGAWKVAYADFVTAMMAFFLLMWLLNATTEDQRKGIADYFNPTIPISPMSGGGKDVLNGSSVFADESLAKDGSGGNKGDAEEQQQSAENAENKEKIDNPLQIPPARETLSQIMNDTEDLDAFEGALRNHFDGDAQEALSQHLQTRLTPEGLMIELIDVDGSPLFELGSTTASPTMELLLGVVTKSLGLVTNGISIEGHTDGRAFSSTNNYSNWELSTDRAHVARRLMIDSGLPLDQVREVAGKADTDPLVEDKLAPQNRRISITILKS